MRLAAVILALWVSGVSAAVVVDDPRYCGPAKRDAAGKIIRSDSVTRRFQYRWPCPSTGSQIGACPGWAKDHTIPLSEGGCDAVGNLQWLPDSIKSGPHPDNKDRWERRVYKQQ